MEDDQKQRPESLLPYEKWIEQALRHVVAQAIEHVAVQGLPGGHHFYITFRTDHPGVEIPQRIRAQYPQEMTIVLQHQFWDLTSTGETQAIQVGLSFGGVPSKLVIPLDAVVEFADPHIRYGLRFQRRRTSRRRSPRRRRHRRRQIDRRRGTTAEPRRGRWLAWTRSAAASPPGVKDRSWTLHQRPASFLYSPMFPLAAGRTPWRKLAIEGVRSIDLRRQDGPAHRA